MGTVAQITLGLIVGTVVAGAVFYSVGGNLSMLNLVEQKLQTIHTPAPPIGSLTPARDLRGTWRSSLQGKGLQLYGQFNTGPGKTSVYEDGDIELIINTMEGNTATGTIQYTNLCSWGGTSVPGFGNVAVPRHCVNDSGAMPTQIRVSSSHLDFGTVAAAGANFTMQGNYTTDIISGTMSGTVPPYGVLKGEFHLNRMR